MATCGFSGNSDMYGLGIRIGFYLLWFGTIFADWLAPTEVPGLRFSNSLFIAATFLGLIIQTAHDSLRPVEIYIVLLLTFGRYLWFVPMYLWRIALFLTGNRIPDFSRYPRVLAGPIYSALNFILLVSVSGFQLWFWFSRVNGLESKGCPEYGFFFGKLLLNNKGFVVANILFHFALLFCCLVVIYLSAQKAAKLRHFEGSEYGSDVESDGGSISDVQRVALQEVYTASNLIVACVVTTATELTISWNSIRDVNDINSVGQTIPLIIGIGLVVRVLYINSFGDIDGEYRDNHQGGIASNTSITSGSQGSLTDG